MQPVHFVLCVAGQTVCVRQQETSRPRIGVGTSVHVVRIRSGERAFVELVPVAKLGTVRRPAFSSSLVGGAKLGPEERRHPITSRIATRPWTGGLSLELRRHVVKRVPCAVSSVVGLAAVLAFDTDVVWLALVASERVGGVDEILGPWADVLVRGGAAGELSVPLPAQVGCAAADTHERDALACRAHELTDMWRHFRFASVCHDTRSHPAVAAAGCHRIAVSLTDTCA